MLFFAFWGFLLLHGHSVELVDTSCGHCIHIPLSLANRDGAIESTNLVCHPGDDFGIVSQEACTSIGLEEPCFGQVVESLEYHNWAPANWDSINSPLSRHQVQTILYRIRKFQNPRVLLLGAGIDTPMWYVVVVLFSFCS